MFAFHLDEGSGLPLDASSNNNDATNFNATWMMGDGGRFGTNTNTFNYGSHIS